MPRKEITVTTESGPVDLTSNFTSTNSGTDYNYTESENLRVLIRFTSGSTENVATYPLSSTLTIVAENDGIGDTYQTQDILGRNIATFEADDTNNKQIEMTFSGTPPHALTFGDGSSDSPFSVSFWVKLDDSYSATGRRYFFANGRNATDSEYWGYYTPSSAATDPNSLTLELVDDSNTYNIKHTVDGVNLEDREWHHIAMTYSGGGGADVRVEMKFYLDGVAKTNTVRAFNNTTGYVAMDPVSNVFQIGASRQGVAEIDGFMAEFAVFGSELSQQNVQAIYYAQSDLVSEITSFKSGYLNLSPRIQQRNLDNRSGCIPTVHRMGDKDRSGKNNIFYEDLNINFGNSLYDDFDSNLIAGGIGFASAFKSHNWDISAGMTIRTENLFNGTFINPCVVFSGIGTGGKRYIRSIKKIKDPLSFYFELIQGPYNEGHHNCLNLKGGQESYTLKLQISTNSNFSSPIDIATYELNTNQAEFYEVTELEEIRRKKVTLQSKDFPDLGEAYYFRFVQENFSNNENNWAINKIDIQFANQNIVYPILLSTGSDSNRFKNKAISSPHTLGNIVAAGRSTKSAIDNYNPFLDFSENISAFDETLVVENKNNIFFNQGTPEFVYPGFKTATHGKTKFIVDLSPSEETTFGYINRIAGFNDGAGRTDTTGTGQQLMVYWNSDLRRWEKTGKALHANNVNSPSSETLKKLYTSSCLGFSRSSILGTYTNTDTQLSTKNVLATSHKPISLHSFPTGPQYFATSSHYILAKDIGITKPFLLEKLSLRFESKFESPSTGSANHSSHQQSSLAMCPIVHDNRNNFGNQDYVENLRIITPTFFMLRQFKNNLDEEVVYFTRSTATDDTTDSYEYSIPGNFEITDGTTDLTYVDSSRELITYAQHTLFLTGASGGSGFDLSSFSIQEIVNSGYPVDSYSIHNFNVESSVNPSDVPFSLTQSFTINAETRNISKYPKINLNFSKVGTNTYTNIGFGKDSFSRSSGIENARGIVNGNASTELTEDKEFKVLAFNPNQPFATQKGPNYTTIDQNSPYLILPNDKLILGWQYPLKNSLRDDYGIPGDDSDSGLNSMTLFGKSKLYLYGSEIVENKEYHETLNQNLTSCAVYEHIIGNDKVVDQWEVAYRGELTGSNQTLATFNLGPLYDISTSDSAWKYAYGNYVVSNFGIGDGTPSRYNSLKDNKGEKRIGLTTLSTTSDIYDKVYDKILPLYVAALGEPLGTAAAAIATGNITQFIQSGNPRGITYFDENRAFFDASLPIETYVKDSSYGVLNRTVKNYTTTPEYFFDIGPKYTFSTRHFGHYADMLRQGKDSKFKITSAEGLSLNDRVVNSTPPVSMFFVEKSFDIHNNLVFTKKPFEYFLERPSFQSSNISTYMTSSKPFIEGEASVPLKAPSNRPYGEENEVVDF